MIILLSYFITTFVGQRTRVDGHSMENTLFHNDNLIVDKLSYRFKKPSRFDIIVFPHWVENKKKYYIKRIIGLPGETVFIDEYGDIYINGTLLIESYGKENINDAGLASSPITLKEDEYFVLGDNRNNSSDSRDSRDPRVGVITHKEIVGKAFFRIFPFSQVGLV